MNEQRSVPQGRHPVEEKSEIERRPLERHGISQKVIKRDKCGVIQIEGCIFPHRRVAASQRCFLSGGWSLSRYPSFPHRACGLSKRLSSRWCLPEAKNQFSPPDTMNSQRSSTTAARSLLMVLFWQASSKTLDFLLFFLYIFHEIKLNFALFCFHFSPPGGSRFSTLSNIRQRACGFVKLIERTNSQQEDGLGMLLRCAYRHIRFHGSSFFVAPVLTSGLGSSKHLC